jgi:membrane protein DedA with SNARE-associated domain
LLIAFHDLGCSNISAALLRVIVSADVFFGRWLPGMRVVTSWLAGANRMRWRRLLFWNALGGISWATTIGVLAYLVGRSASGSLGAIGLVGLGVAVAVYLVVRVRRSSHARSRKSAQGQNAQHVPR